MGRIRQEQVLAADQVMSDLRVFIMQVNLGGANCL
jgi:hypothetical protein